MSTGFAGEASSHVRTATLDGSSRGLAANASLVDLFEEQVQRHPGRIAIDLGGAKITYDDLNRRADQLAQLLLRIGVDRGQLVAVLTGRCAEAYVAILGILKAGAAYLPIDPAYPRDRIGHMISHGRPRAIVTRSGSLHQAGSAPFASVIALDELKPFQRAKKKGGRVFDAHDLRASPALAPPGGRSRAGDLAYVIFTSGTSGAPKGVMVEHRSVANLIAWARSAFHVTPRSRVLQSYSIAFDSSVQEIFLALLSGATLIPVPEDVRLNPPRFLGWITDNAISYWDTVPSLWYRIVDHVTAHAGGGKLSLPHLETLVLGGEALSGAKVRAWLSCVERNHSIFNVYGPTEATVSATCYRVPADEARDVVPIGVPLWNTEIHVLDQALAPCPPGVDGELCVAGVGLARGYLGAPDSAAFVEGVVPDRRLYRTGDLGRRLPDGTLEFRGRADDQVKVRGFRVELSEIEAALRGHSALGEVAVAVAADEATGHKSLVAFYTSKAGVTVDELRGYASAKLPWFMVPHRFVPVDVFPLTPSDKVDKAALLQLPPRGAPRSTTSRPPAGGTEALLAGVWREILKLDEIGADDDFFSLGGDSLLTVMVQHRCEQEGVRLRAIDIFRHPTIRALARTIDQSTLATATPPPRAAFPLSPRERAILPRDAAKALPLLSTQRTMLHESARCAGAYLPQAILRCQGTVDLAALERAVNVIVSRHEALRTVFRADVGPEPVQVVLSGVRCAIRHEDLSAAPLDELAAADEPPSEDAFRPRKHQVWPGDGARAEASSAEARAHDRYVTCAADAVLARGFDPARWPPFEIAVYTRPGARFDIVWTTHHLVMDGWSTSLFYRELALVYSSIVTRRFRPLPPIRAALSDVVGHARGKDAGAARRFWEERLAGATCVDLPRDLPPREGASPRIEKLTFTLDEETTQALKRCAREHAATIASVCLAAHYLVLRELVGRDDITAGVVTSGRSDGLPGTENVIGNLISIVPLRLRLSGGMTFGEIARLAQTTLSDAIAHDHLDLSEIAALLGRAPGALPFDVLFISESYPSPAELGVEPFPDFSVLDVVARERNTCPFTVVSSEDRGRLVFSVEYAADRFAAGAVRAWAERFLDVLGRAG